MPPFLDLSLSQITDIEFFLYLCGFTFPLTYREAGKKMPLYFTFKLFLPTPNIFVIYSLNKALYILRNFTLVLEIYFFLETMYVPGLRFLYFHEIFSLFIVVTSTFRA